MKVVILGAAGKTGAELVTQALAGGHTVVAFVRVGEKVTPQPNLGVVEGDARSEADLAIALTGADAVVSSLGSMKAGDALILRSTQALIGAAAANNVKRVVMMSSFLVTPNNKPTGLMKLFTPLLKGMVADKASGEDMLKGSDLDWTIVYATSLDKAPKGGVVRIVPEDEVVGMKNGIARADVATYMLAALADQSLVKKAVLITVK
jgi:putative NADH-flavin reductase